MVVFVFKEETGFEVLASLLGSEMVIRDRGMALNDRYGRPTLEFRLGRGTLNKSSFFAWIDLCLTMVRNSRKSSKKLEDAAEWLDGIQLTTAQYLVSRNAFVDAIRRTMPEAFWVFDQNDCQENEAA